ncbi:MAG: imidazoleglycerol-phosphate dehydratase, partial [Chloroflexota bacterium]
MTVAERRAELTRETSETRVQLAINLDGRGESQIASGIGFLDHMLTLFARHGRFDLMISASGDTQVDDHHTAEDVAIVLGRAVQEALGDKRGIARYGQAHVPMDEALVRAVIDLSGRPYCLY